jgi:hypothetical protein
MDEEERCPETYEPMSWKECLDLDKFYGEFERCYKGKYVETNKKWLATILKLCPAIECRYVQTETEVDDFKMLKIIPYLYFPSIGVAKYQFAQKIEGIERAFEPNFMEPTLRLSRVEDKEKIYNPFPTDFFGYNVAQAMQNGTFPNTQTADFIPSEKFFEQIIAEKSESMTSAWKEKKKMFHLDLQNPQLPPPPEVPKPVLVVHNTICYQN